MGEDVEKGILRHGPDNNIRQVGFVAHTGGAGAWFEISHAQSPAHRFHIISMMILPLPAVTGIYNVQM